ncbi:MAG: hypothetical protein WAN48_09975 [Actinomycetes bacterium]
MSTTPTSEHLAQRSATQAAATAAVAAGSLVAGYGVAAATDVRALGGVVLLAGGGWCARRWWQSSGPTTALALGATYAAAFVVSHPLAKQIGAWPSVFTVAAVTGVVSYVATRSHSAQPTDVPTTTG